MKFRLKCKEVDGKELNWEEYDREDFTSINQAKKWAKDAVDYFNKTLRPGEVPRKLLKVEMIK